MEIMEKYFTTLDSIFGSSAPVKEEVMAEMKLSRPPVVSTKLSALPMDSRGAAYLREYAELAKAIGVTPPDMSIEAFKAFMMMKDLPVYALSEVVKYMDKIAEKESRDKSGWEWRPFRAKDLKMMQDVKFGTEASWSGLVYLTKVDYPHE